MQNHEDQQIKKPKPAKLDKDKWSKLIAAWQESGESRKQFCQRHGLNINAFVYMQGKFKLINKMNKIQPFIPVITVPDDNKAANDAITVENKTGIKLHIPLSLSPDKLTNLLNLLGWKHA